MSIKRQYSLPNCVLTLEGLTEDEQKQNRAEEPAVMSTLIKAECKLVNSGKILVGGRQFLDDLVKAVSEYSQECLSGLPHTTDKSQTIKLQPLKQGNLHLLSIEPPADTNQEKQEITLTTVELFDLVEAIDRLLADESTLPDSSLNIQPLHKRYRQIEENIAQRSTSAALGIATLAAAAIAFALIPPPEVKKPVPAQSEGEKTKTEQLQTNPPSGNSENKSESKQNP
ncbi:MAG: DUF4335 domain-containing protein [Cyanobacteria bacterium J083]|nr:MAG: DUF4335 domain-containing protein [Cyanobacteria bacterium J083]